MGVAEWVTIASGVRIVHPHLRHHAAGATSALAGCDGRSGSPYLAALAVGERSPLSVHFESLRYANGQPGILPAQSLRQPQPVASRGCRGRHSAQPTTQHDQCDQAQPCQQGAQQRAAQTHQFGQRIAVFLGVAITGFDVDEHVGLRRGT
jgi:hypothetical protein